MARIRSNRICFTLNNFTKEDSDGIVTLFDGIEKLAETPAAKQHDICYMVVGEEMGESGTPHLQGFIRSTLPAKSCGLKYWQGILPMSWGSRAHYENARGSDEQNRVYCSKDGIFREFGLPGQEGTCLYGRIVDAAKRSIDEALDIDKELGLKHFSQIVQIYERFNVSTPESEIVDLRPWQQTVLELLNKQSKRQILFVVDEGGGKGKSELTKYLLCRDEPRAWACQGGATRDLMTAYDVKCTIAIFDMARTNKPEYFPYQFMENIKNGWFCATKYRGGRQCFRAPAVVVFTNEQPDRTRFTQDRYQIFII